MIVSVHIKIEYMNTIYFTFEVQRESKLQFYNDASSGGYVDCNENEIKV